MAADTSIPAVIRVGTASRQVLVKDEDGVVVYRCFAPTPQVARAMFEEWAATQTPEDVPEGQYRIELAFPSKPKPDDGQIHA